MPKADLQSHTLNLCRGDYEKIQEMYPDVGAATIIRRVVRKFIEQIEDQGIGDLGTQISTDI